MLTCLLYWGAYNRVNIWRGGIAAVAAFCTTGTTITLVGLVLGKIFISRLAHYNAMNT